MYKQTVVAIKKLIKEEWRAILITVVMFGVITCFFLILTPKNAIRKSLQQNYSISIDNNISIEKMGKNKYKLKNPPIDWQREKILRIGMCQLLRVAE